MRSRLVIFSTTIFLLAVLAAPAYAAANSIAWRKFFAADPQAVGPTISATDRNGNLIVVRTEGDYVSVSKYRAGGSRVWKKLFGAFGTFTSPAGIATDRDGNIYVVGTTEGDDYQELGFIRKYGPKGGHHWTKKFGPAGEWAMTWVTGVAVGPGGAIYVVGVTDGDFSGKTDGYWMMTTFLRKYTAGGKVYWTRQFGADRYDEDFEYFGVDVAVGPGGGVYVLADKWGYGYLEEKERRALSVRRRGQLQSQKDSEERAYIADPESEEYIEDNWGDMQSVVLKKYSPRGGVYWTREFGAKKSLVPAAVAVDRTGSPVIVGAAFRGSFGTKFSHKGRRQWTRFWSDLDLLDVAVDRDRNIYVVGVEGTADNSWDTGQPAYPKAYTSKLGPSGERHWARRFLYGVAGNASIDSEGNLYVAGYALLREQDFIVKFRN